MKTVMFGGGSGSPDSPEWHAWRAAGIGGSDSIIVAASAGLIHPAPSWVKPAQWLWAVKTGRASGAIPENPAMRRGKLGEGPARDAFVKKTGIQVSPMFGEMEGEFMGMDTGFIRASFDGVSFCQRTLVEIKCPGERAHQEVDQHKIPKHYLVQMAHQGLVLWGHPDNWASDVRAYYVSYNPEADDMKHLDHVKDGGVYFTLVGVLKELARQLLPELVAFWTSVSSDTLPCGPAWMAAASRYLAIEAEIDEAKARLEGARTHLLDLLGDKTKEVGGGLSVIRSTRKGAVDYPGLIKSVGITDDQVEAFRKPGSESISIRRTVEKDFEIDK